jgi:hypothetical protein
MTLLALERGKKCFYYVPSSNYFRPTWDELIHNTTPAISSINKTEKWVRYRGGGEIWFFSCAAADAGRGKFCDEMFFDEVAFAQESEYFWKNVMNPMLLDRRGNATFASSPQGDNYFKVLCETEHPDWSHFHYTSYDNPYIDSQGIDDMRLLLPEQSFNQEYLAEFVTLSDTFCYAFSKAKHVADCEYAPNQTIYISFDFNIDPITAIVVQRVGNNINILEEFRILAGNIYTICAQIKYRYPDSHLYEITGDPAGNNRTIASDETISFYKMIQKQLGVRMGQIKPPFSQSTHKQHRLLSNALFHSHKGIRINPRCTHLINDLTYVRADQHGKIVKETTGMGKLKTHLLDCLLNYFYTYHSNYVKYL